MQAGHPALEDMVQLPPGSEPPSVPVSLTLTAGDKCAHSAVDSNSAGRGIHSFVLSKWITNKIGASN